MSQRSDSDNEEDDKKEQRGSMLLGWHMKAKPGKSGHSAVPQKCQSGGELVKDRQTKKGQDAKMNLTGQKRKYARKKEPKGKDKANKADDSDDKSNEDSAEHSQKNDAKDGRIQHLNKLDRKVQQKQ